MTRAASTVARAGCGGSAPSSSPSWSVPRSSPPACSSSSSWPGSPATNDPRTLLIAGGKVWLTNNVAFALLYWQFDGRGPAERAHGLPPYPDLAFPQLSAPDLAPPDWRPRFTDYLYIAFTTANAFSPTDTLPLTTWAKFAMATQALVSFVLLGLVLARAVNAFS